MKRSPFPCLASALAAAVLLAPLPIAAQHGLADGGPWDPSVPTPASVLGYDLGERFTTHHMILRYAEAVARSSPRVRLDTVAITFEGREVLLLTVSSEANMARLDEIRRAAARLADPRGAASPELARLVATTPTIVWLGHSVHGNEASGVEAALATLYELAASGDAGTRMVLDSVVVLIDPVQNPDGHERHVQQVLRDRGRFADPNPLSMDHVQDWQGARTSHYLFDLNRDWVMHTHPETRGRMEVFTSWWPHVAADLHEMGHNTTYFFAPPMEPVNEHVHPLIWKGWERFSQGNAAAFDAAGLGFFTREGFDEFFPGYGPSWPIMSGAIGMTYEQASSRGGLIERDDRTLHALRDATFGHYMAARATLRTAAAYRTERVADYLAFRQAAVRDNARAAMRTVVIADDGQGRAAALAEVLGRHGIEVGRLDRAVDLPRTTSYMGGPAGRVRAPAGSWVIDLAQPQGVMARALLEPDPRLAPAFVAEELARRVAGQPGRFYDMTAWALPFLFRVDAWWTGQAVAAAAPAAGAPAAPAGAGAIERAGYAYAFEPGSRGSYRLLAALLADDVRVRHSPRAFTAAGRSFPNGALVVVVERNDPGVHDLVRDHAAAAGVPVVALHGARVDQGADLGSTSVGAVRPVRVALAGGPGVAVTSFGAAWHALDEWIGYPATRLRLAELVRALDDFDVVVIPSAPGLDRELGEGGADALNRWVRAGGRLVTFDAATAWAASDAGPARLRILDPAERPEGAEGAPLPASVPGAILRAEADTLSPLLAGVTARELPVMMFGARIYEAPSDVRPGEVVVRHAAEERLRLGGFLWPEVPARVAGSPWLWSERVGSGRVIAFTSDPAFRGMWPGLLPLFANAIFLGGSP